jgi:preprotein translocase SecF subunit
VLHLVKYRFVFLAFSLLIIIPGLISLAVFHLKVGIDFAGGSSIQFRPQTEFKTTAEVEKYITPLGLRDPQIIFGENKALAGDHGEKTVWVRLNTQIDNNVLNSIQTTLKNKYPNSKINVQPLDVTGANNKTYTLLTLSGFDTAPQTSDIRQLLSKLPNTGTPGLTATPTAQATAAATPTTAAQATPTAKATAQASATPAATPTATSSSAANTPVNVVDISQGTTAQTVTILTTTPIENQGKGDQPRIQAAFLGANGPYLQFTNISSVGGSVASETTRNAVLAVIAASAFILLYIWFSFRKVAKAWRYGTCAIIALLHDVLVVLGVFSILGEIVGIQVDALFLTALLTVVGFSVHDTIVVFDRIRENMQRHTTESFEDVVNASLIQTMTRSLNTSLTVLLTLLALTLFSTIGSSVHTFTLTLLIGIFSGTFSSIFNASMLLVMWEKHELFFAWFNRDKDRQPSNKREREARELARARG